MDITKRNHKHSERGPPIAEYLRLAAIKSFGGVEHRTTNPAPWQGGISIKAGSGSASQAVAYSPPRLSVNA